MNIFIRNTGEKTETVEELTGKSLADNVSCIDEADKTPSGLLTECIYEDFVKAR